MGRKSKVINAHSGDGTTDANPEETPPSAGQSNLLPGIQGLLPGLGGLGTTGLQGLLQGASPAGPSGSPLLALLGANPSLIAAAQASRPSGDNHRSHVVDPDVQEMCDHFHIEDRHAKRLSDLMRNRQDTFEQDLEKLWEVLETARSPAGLLTVKMREMEEGSFIGKARPDKELEAMGRKFRLDDQALSKLADVLARRKETRKEDMAQLEKHLEISNRPSAMAMMLLARLREGTPLGDPVRDAAPGSYLDRLQRERGDRGGTKPQSCVRGGSQICEHIFTY